MDAPRKVDRAEALLRELLADGPRPEAEIMEAMRQAGIGEKTVRNTKGMVGVLSRKRGARGGGQWDWSLSDGGVSALAASTAAAGGAPNEHPP